MEEVGLKFKETLYKKKTTTIFLFFIDDMIDNMEETALNQINDHHITDGATHFGNESEDNTVKDIVQRLESKEIKVMSTKPRILESMSLEKQKEESICPDKFDNKSTYFQQKSKKTRNTNLDLAFESICKKKLVRNMSSMSQIESNKEYHKPSGMVCSADYEHRNFETFVASGK